MSLLINLDSYWKFDEASGNAADATASANTLTNNGTATYSAGALNNAVNFVAASSQYLSRLNASLTGLQPTGDCSVSGWVKLTTTTFGSAMASRYDTSTGNGTSYIFGRIASSTSVTGTICDANASCTIATFNPSALSTATWYHMVFIYHAAVGSMDMYLNGTLVSTQTGLKTSILVGNSDFRVGLGNPGGAEYWNGSIDEMGFWSKALTGTEVTQLYNNGTPLPYSSFSSLVSLPFKALLGVGQ